MNNADYREDLARVGQRRPFLKEQSLWAIRVYRFGRMLDQRRPGLVTAIGRRFYWPMFRLVETITGISLPKEASIGAGLRIWHFGGIFVHPASVVGRNCTLRQGVTIGNRIAGGPVPMIGDDVEIGAYAQILGGIRIGNGCRIGAMSVVLTDVPDETTVVGNPARIIAKRAEGRKHD